MDEGEIVKVEFELNNGKKLTLDEETLKKLNEETRDQLEESLVKVFEDLESKGINPEIK